jgi:hypothetical protein
MKTKPEMEDKREEFDGNDQDIMKKLTLNAKRE